MQGLESGFGTAFDSTLSGLRGVVMKPADGFRQDGASGFAVGALQGVAGILVKPVTGEMDLVSKTSQGIEAASKKDSQ
jgi:vacuolar protein sorting-associated protein 13A/C